jgi:hypothetical protein
MGEPAGTTYTCRPLPRGTQHLVTFSPGNTLAAMKAALGNIPGHLELTAWTRSEQAIILHFYEPEDTPRG